MENHISKPEEKLQDSINKESKKERREKNGEKCKVLNEQR